jgi:LysR family carnitine catabolism transcriptional activator
VRWCRRTTRSPGGPDVTWAELGRAPFVDFAETSSIRHHVDRSFTVAGVMPAKVVAARNIAAVAGFVAAGLGLSAVPGPVVPLTAFAGLVAVPLREPIARRRIALVHPRTPFSTTAAAFAEVLTRAAGRPGLPPHVAWTT